MKNSIIIIIITILLACLPDLFAQGNIDSVIFRIEKNNKTLMALRDNVKAEKIGNKTGLYLANPEAGFHYLQGYPEEMGNRTDLSISQSFEFPTVYIYQSQISDLENNKVDLKYESEKKTLLLKARLLIYDLIYLNAMEAELSKRFEHASRISDSYQSKFNNGGSTILELNKAKLNLLNIGKELESIRIQQAGLLEKLKTLNGGEKIVFTDSAFYIPDIPENFKEWYERAEEANPMLNWLRKEITSNEKQVRLNRAESMPDFKAGYMSEKVAGEQFRGLTFGISIPLWEDKNKVKHAKARTEATRTLINDQKLQYYSNMKRLHSKTVNLLKNVEEYRSELEMLDHTKLISKALDRGEISLIDYILELGIYYESFERLLQMEKDLNKSFAELMKYSNKL